MQERRIYFSNNHFQNITNQYNSIKIKYVREGKGSGQEPVSGRGQEHGKGQLNRGLGGHGHGRGQEHGMGEKPGRGQGSPRGQEYGKG